MAFYEKDTLFFIIMYGPNFKVTTPLKSEKYSIFPKFENPNLERQ